MAGQAQRHRGGAESALCQVIKAVVLFASATRSNVGAGLVVAQSAWEARAIDLKVRLIRAGVASVCVIRAPGAVLESVLAAAIIDEKVSGVAGLALVIVVGLAGRASLNIATLVTVV